MLRNHVELHFLASRIQVLVVCNSKVCTAFPSFEDALCITCIICMQNMGQIGECILDFLFWFFFHKNPENIGICYFPLLNQKSFSLSLSILLFRSCSTTMIDPLLNKFFYQLKMKSKMFYLSGNLYFLKEYFKNIFLQHCQVKFELDLISNNIY